METTAKQAAAAPTKKGTSTVLIVVLIVVLIGGGVGLFFALKPKKDEKKKEQKPTGTNGQSGASGRQVVDHRPRYSADFLKSLLSQNGQTPPPNGKGSSASDPLYYKSPKALELIANTAKDMQLNEPTMDLIRANYNIGKPIITTSVQEQECIDKLFGSLRNIDLTTDPDRKFLAYPVYGTFEPTGKKYRTELQNLINAGWEGLNLTDLRDSSEPWWLKEIGLNLLVGTTWSNTPTTHNTWASYAPRTELDFFKQFNRHWVDDKDLADVYINRNNTQQVVSKGHPDARSAYCATGMYEFVKRWVAEIDRLDEMTRFEAFKWLQQPNDNGKRWYFSYVNPDTGEDEENTNNNPFNIGTTTKGGTS